MKNDPRFAALVKLLREHGWIDVDSALYAPGTTIWIELDVDWPASVSDFHETMVGRLERLRNRATMGFEDIDLQTSILDTSDLVGCLSRVLSDP